MSGGDKRGERAALRAGSGAGLGTGAGAAFIGSLAVVAVAVFAVAGPVFGSIYTDREEDRPGHGPHLT